MRLEQTHTIIDAATASITNKKSPIANVKLEMYALRRVHGTQYEWSKMCALSMDWNESNHQITITATTATRAASGRAMLTKMKKILGDGRKRLSDINRNTFAPPTHIDLKTSKWPRMHRIHALSLGHRSLLAETRQMCVHIGGVRWNTRKWPMADTNPRIQSLECFDAHIVYTGPISRMEKHYCFLFI